MWVGARQLLLREVLAQLRGEPCSTQEAPGRWMGPGRGKVNWNQWCSVYTSKEAETDFGPVCVSVCVRPCVCVCVRVCVCMPTSNLSTHWHTHQYICAFPQSSLYWPLIDADQINKPFIWLVFHHGQVVTPWTMAVCTHTVLPQNNSPARNTDTQSHLHKLSSPPPVIPPSASRHRFAVVVFLLLFCFSRLYNRMFSQSIPVNKIQE